MEPTPTFRSSRIQRKWQFKDDFSKTIGKHTFKGGVDYIWNPVEGGFFEFSSTLEIDFGADPSTILSDSPPVPTGFATPGAVTGMTQANGDPYFLVATKQLGFYGQDDWKTTRRLTLSLGLRWDKDFNMIGGSDIKKAAPTWNWWLSTIRSRIPTSSHRPG